jgi:hypothetical protein
MTNWTTRTRESGEVTYIGAADTAKLVRKQLKKHFPDTKFSVRTSHYSMGASIRVRWTDGPTTSQVDPIVGQFAGARFDGMIDLKYHAEHWLLPDGTARVRREYGHSYTEAEAHNEDEDDRLPEGSKRVHFSADYIFTERDLSERFRGVLESRLRERWGSKERALEQTRTDWYTLVWRESTGITAEAGSYRKVVDD